ncbi:hypothetical protein [Pseudoxanthomonas kaohsiungensis]|uniref:DUF4440 domain-containing protein n=1 Tax=Pseudoxanthomonas kaohsiungensis TaxID=283923 RepID=A0ABW3LY47_9GAMM|nr:hypothetical protein [Pseudoxanthomonas kaohsiungensis]KAF1700591.1 hypothetical protein CSC66_15565 [Pseudoxanthomonas kaohsiungensis]
MVEPTTTFAEILRRDLGPDFPVVSGTSKADSPLVISETRDYVAVEYAIARQFMRAIGEEWKLAEQRLLHRDGRAIDELVVNVKDEGAPDWQGRRRFYFDITAGWRATYGDAPDH